MKQLLVHVYCCCLAGDGVGRSSIVRTTPPKLREPLKPMLTTGDVSTSMKSLSLKEVTTTKSGSSGQRSVVVPNDVCCDTLYAVFLWLPTTLCCKAAVKVSINMLWPLSESQKISS